MNWSTRSDVCNGVSAAAKENMYKIYPQKIKKRKNTSIRVFRQQTKLGLYCICIFIFIHNSYWFNIPFIHAPEWLWFLVGHRWANWQTGQWPRQMAEHWSRIAPKTVHAYTIVIYICMPCSIYLAHTHTAHAYSRSWSIVLNRVRI